MKTANGQSPIDVGIYSDPASGQTVETKQVQSFFFYMDEKKKAAARDSLRNLTEYDRYKTEDQSANVILEQLWNILAENY